ncbi:hypothetical protein EHS25_008883 [Saitozyma podzolica]|uniref:Uncharacterized protein n=1 Tax=Saitozyma podzolica TaxID=1890683 RepID=A0A427YN32_9TREE|nr:hypothetical protein EHS25_008883 [Saitozyma podzolica]
MTKQSKLAKRRDELLSAKSTRSTAKSTRLARSNPSIRSSRTPLQDKSGSTIRKSKIDQRPTLKSLRARLREKEKSLILDEAVGMTPSRSPTRSSSLDSNVSSVWDGVSPSSSNTLRRSLKRGASETPESEATESVSSVASPGRGLDGISLNDMSVLGFINLIQSLSSHGSEEIVRAETKMDYSSRDESSTSRVTRAAKESFGQRKVCTSVSDDGQGRGPIAASESTVASHGNGAAAAAAAAAVAGVGVGVRAAGARHELSTLENSLNARITALEQGRIATSGGADLLASAIRYSQSLTPSVPNSVWSQAVSLFHSTYPELIRIQSLSGGTGLTSGSPTEDARIRNALDGVIESNKRGMSESGWEVREGETEERSFLRFAEEQMVLERQEELARKEFWSRMQSVPQFGSGSGSCSGSGSEFGRASGIGSEFGTDWAGVNLESAWEGRDGSVDASKGEAVGVGRAIRFGYQRHGHYTGLSVRRVAPGHKWKYDHRTCTVLVQMKGT